MKILSDSGQQDSARARPMYGYHDYTRTIVFSSDSTKEEIQKYLHDIWDKNKNLWMWWRADEDPQVPSAYILRYGYDSGD